MNILVAVDREPESADAALAAKEFFGDDHHYTFLSIADYVTSVGSISRGLKHDLIGLADTVKEYARKSATMTARKHAKATAVTNSEIAVEVGAVGRTICQHALDTAADIIVMGSREHSIWGWFFDPSAGRYVIDNAPCPVLVVR